MPRVPPAGCDSVRTTSTGPGRLAPALLVVCSSGSSAEGRGRDWGCWLSPGGNCVCFSRVDEGGMCCCCCRRKTWACRESGGCRTRASLCMQLCPAGGQCPWGCYCSFLKRGWQRLATLVAPAVLAFRVPVGGQPAAAPSLRQRRVSAGACLDALGCRQAGLLRTANSIARGVWWSFSPSPIPFGVFSMFWHFTPPLFFKGCGCCKVPWAREA